MPRAGWSFLCLLIAACGESRAVRLVAGHADTVIVNRRVSAPLAVRIIDEKGIERPAKGVRFHSVRGGDIALAEDGRVTCDRPGDASVTVTRGKLSTQLTILCRPIQGVFLPRVVRLRMGDPPVPLDVGAYGKDGRPIDVIAGAALVGDSQVAALVDGYIHARAPGATTVEVEAGDCVTSIPVEVIESSLTSEGMLPHQQFASSLSMSAGELRSWRLPAGRYHISLFDRGKAPDELRLASHQMNCASLPGTEQQYSCIASDRAAVIVHHTRPAGSGRPATATLVVHRQADLATESARWRPNRVLGCPVRAR
jgi:hypothetical protein